MSIEAKCGCPAESDTTIVVNHNAQCALVPWPDDESLANFWKDWPKAANQYRLQKQQQVGRLQITVNALQDSLRERDALLLSTMYALQDFVRWWSTDELDGDQVKELERVAARIRGALRT